MNQCYQKQVITEGRVVLNMCFFFLFPQLSACPPCSRSVKTNTIPYPTLRLEYIKMIRVIGSSFTLIILDVLFSRMNRHPGTVIFIPAVLLELVCAGGTWPIDFAYNLEKNGLKHCLHGSVSIRPDPPA
jgi:hypothetical protein